MIAFNRDEIGGLPSTQDLPVSPLEARLTLVLGETVFLRPVATRTLCQADLQESETFGPGSSYKLRKKHPFDHSARVVTVQKLVTFLARPDKGA